VAVRIVRLGSPRSVGEGLRIGTVRRPPRGVRKDDIPKRDFYDVWLPNLAPSAELVKLALAAQTASQWQAFVRAYRKQMGSPDARHVIGTLAALSQQTDFAVGCYCENEERCHRSVLRQLLREAGALLECADQ
jgi:uncharacterized protein YeaO (DUF488 family)